MKILILLLALGLCVADAVPGGYQQIDTTEALADSTIQGYIQTGLQAIEQNAISKGYFNNSDFTLSQLNSVYEQVVNGANYKFNATFTDSEGILLQANFIVHQSASTNNAFVSSFVYHILYPAVTTTTSTTVPATSTESSNTTPTSATAPAESGETEDVTTTVETGETVVTEEEISPVEIVAESGETATSAESDEAVIEEGETSAVEIVESGEGATAVETEISAESGETVLVEEGEISPVIIVENGEAATSAESGESGESSIESGQATTGNTTAPSNTTSTNSTVVGPDGFTEIASDEFAQSEDLQKYFAFGFQTVVQAGINAGKIPNVTFNAAQALNAGEKDINNGELYKFTAQASNGGNVDIELTFEVELKVPAYSYKVQVTTTTPVNNTGSTAGTGSTTSDNSTTVDTGSTSDNSTITTGPSSDNSTTVGTGSSSNNSTTTTGSDSDNSTTTTPVVTGSGSDNTTASSNTTTSTNSTNTTSTEQWVSIDLSQVQSNAEIQTTLSNGFNQVMQGVFAKNYLPVDNYTITQVVAASYYNLTYGADYKFTVLANNDEQTIFLNLNFTAYYRYSNQSVKAVAYHYNYYTKAVPKPPQNTTSDNNTSSGNPTAPVVNNTSPANNTAPVVNNTAPANNTNKTSSPDQNGYFALSADQIQAQDVQNAINWGSSQVVQLGIQKGKIPSDTYNITQVASVLKKIQPSGANYNATVTLQSAANVTVNTNFNVYWNSTSNDMILKAYAYGVRGIKSSGK